MPVTRIVFWRIRWGDDEERKKKNLDKQCNPMYFQGVRTISKSDSTGPQRFGRSWPNKPNVGGLHRFTNTAVPRFDGTGCWEQHLLVFQAITKSNGWSADTAALQLFAHLDGEALQVALLMPDRIRERWKDFVDELSAYYNAPGRLAVLRRKFENAHRRPGLDPATFDTELGILALRGFSDMKEKARDLMVRNKFIASQQSCDLHRNLDSAAPETSIGDIVDSCRIWESHAEPVAIDNWCQDPEYSQPTLLMPPPPTGSSSRLQYRVGNVMPVWNKSPRRVRHSSADRELLICNVLEAVGARRNVMSERSWSSELELLLREVAPVGLVIKEKTSLPASPPGGGTPHQMDDLGDRGQCFSCGFFGHGVNRCSQLDRSFPYKMPGWSVDVRTDSTVLHECAEMNRTSGGEKRDGSGGRVSLPDHQ